MPKDPSELVTLNVDENLVQSIVMEQVKASVVSALGNSDELIGEVVSFVLNQKVGRDGELSRYSGDNKFNFLDVIVRRSIQHSVEAALTEWCKDNEKKVREAVLKEMNKPKTMSKLAKAFADAAADSMKYDFKIYANVELDPKASGAYKKDEEDDY